MYGLLCCLSSDCLGWLSFVGEKLLKTILNYLVFTEAWDMGIGGGGGGGGEEEYIIIQKMYLFVKNTLIIIFQLDKARHNERIEHILVCWSS